MIQQVMKLQAAGYSILEIGHTKTKLKEDIISKVQFEQLTCNLDNKYYNALKDKVNLVAMCYWENTVENIEEKKNAFTKKMDKVGELTDRKRVMVFADDDNAIDTKTHFEYITSKIDLSAEGFIKAVEEAISLKIAASNGDEDTLKKPKNNSTNNPPVSDESAPDQEDIKPVDEVDSVDEPIESEPEDILDNVLDEELEEEPTPVDKATLDTIRAEFKSASADAKSQVKTILSNYGGRLVSEMKPSDVEKIKTILGI